MAHPYTSRRRIERKIGVEVTRVLCDRDGNGDDVGVLDDAIGAACDIVDSALRQHYAVPFASITDAPPVDGTVRELTTYYAIHLLFSEEDPDADAAKYSGGWLKKFNALLLRITSGDAELSATRVPATDGRVGLEALTTENVFGLDAKGRDRMSRF